MLFCVASPFRVRHSHHPLTQRRATVQMRLPFLDVPVPEASVWEALTDDQRAVVIDVLARLFVNAAVAHALEELPDE
jgi:hypothetical protein